MTSTIAKTLGRGTASVVHGLFYFMYTLFLFNKADIKTTVIPITLLGAASAPIHDICSAPHVVLWVFLNLLQFCVSNQTIDGSEDALIKPWRPIPAKRISHAQAVALRWLLIPGVALYSMIYSKQTMYASLLFSIFTIMHNELEGHRYWYLKNLTNGLGFAALGFGAVLITGANHERPDRVAVLSIIFSSCIFATTTHGQDFKDEAGDRAIGRRTIPIVFGAMAKYMLFVPMLLWSAGLCRMWTVDTVTSVSFIALALYAGSRYLSARSVKEFQEAYVWYNVWLSCAYAMPAYYRLANHGASIVL
ncbi:UbiA prenyltransferase family-domain-containing protein [Cubamyces lactineus]|nr:UbiA prenyltransferase family-domain-containing protein [Cubamyces lactineus]